jgi:ABC-type multidrug transport system ATPase subunit
VDDVSELCSRMAIIDRGRVVLTGEPSQVIAELRGRVWRSSVPRETLADVNRRHQVISTRLVAGIPVVHVYSEGAPGNGFVPVEPNLEDAYFHRVGARAEA